MRSLVLMVCFFVFGRPAFPQHITKERTELTLSIGAGNNITYSNLSIAQCLAADPGRVVELYAGIRGSLVRFKPEWVTRIHENRVNLYMDEPMYISNANFFAGFNMRLGRKFTVGANIDLIGLSHSGNPGGIVGKMVRDSTGKTIEEFAVTECGSMKNNFMFGNKFPGSAYLELQAAYRAGKRLKLKTGIGCQQVTIVTTASEHIRSFTFVRTTYTTYVAISYDLWQLK